MPNEEAGRNVERIAIAAVDRALAALPGLPVPVAGVSVRLSDGRRPGPRAAVFVDYEDRRAQLLADAKGEQASIRQSVLAALQAEGFDGRECLVVFGGRREDELAGKARRAVRRLLDAGAGMTPPLVNHVCLGEADPEHLMLYLAYRDRSALEQARAGGQQERFQALLVGALREQGYPEHRATVLLVAADEVDAVGGPWKDFR